MIQLRNIQLRLFTSKDYASSDVLLHCLVDAKQDATIKSSIDAIVLSPDSVDDSTQGALSPLISLRQHLLDHLIGLAEGGLSIDEACFTNCLENAIYVCTEVPKLRKRSHLHRRSEVRILQRSHDYSSFW